MDSKNVFALFKKFPSSIPEYNFKIEHGIFYLGIANQWQWRILPWSQGMMTQRVINGKFVDDILGFDIPLLRYLTDYKKYCHPIASSWFIDEIPSVIRKIVSSYNYGGFLMLHWAATLPYAHTMLLESPNLLWLLAGYCIQNSNYSIHLYIEQFLALPQAKICKLVGGGSGTKNEPVILKRIVLYEGAKKEWIMIQHLLTHSRLGLLNRIPVISINLLQAVILYPWLCQSKLLDYFSRHRSSVSSNLSFIEHLDRTRADTLILGKMLSHTDAEITFNRCATPDQLSKLHDRWLKKSLQIQDNNDLVKLSLSRPFPPPPVPGNSFIKPITTGLELMREGEKMQHCVFIYCEDIYIGRRYFYHVCHDHPATLELNINAYQKTLQLGQLNGEKNKSPDEDVKIMIDQWMTEHNILQKKNRGFMNNLLTQDEIYALLSGANLNDNADAPNIDRKLIPLITQEEIDAILHDTDD